MAIKAVRVEVSIPGLTKLRKEQFVKTELLKHTTDTISIGGYTSTGVQHGSGFIGFDRAHVFVIAKGDGDGTDRRNGSESSQG